MRCKNRYSFTRSGISDMLSSPISAPVRPWAGWLHCFRSDSNSIMLIHPARGSTSRPSPTSSSSGSTRTPRPATASARTRRRSCPRRSRLAWPRWRNAHRSLPLLAAAPSKAASDSGAGGVPAAPARDGRRCPGDSNSMMLLRRLRRRLRGFFCCCCCCCCCC